MKWPKVVLLVTGCLLMPAVMMFLQCKGPVVQALPLAIPEPDTAAITFLFSGDVMQHMPQIDAAQLSDTNGYSYASCFAYMSRFALAVDIAIANLEVTLAGKPYSGYPQFSAPDALAFDLKAAGYNYLVTANNHSCDRGKKGLERTLKILDSAGIKRTGTFADSADFEKNHPIKIEQKGFRIAVFNYTYGTNGLPVHAPNRVNMLDTAQMRMDIEEIKNWMPHKIIAFVHWGLEYERLPSESQKKLAAFMHKLGFDFIIGSHPHVLQPMHRFLDSASHKELITVYSLGNFVSNQRKPNTDGGASFYLELARNGDSVYIRQATFVLHWVDLYARNGRNHYEILPVTQFENDTMRFDTERQRKFDAFKDSSRVFFRNENTGVREL